MLALNLPILVTCSISFPSSFQIVRITRMNYQMLDVSLSKFRAKLKVLEVYFEIMSLFKFLR